MKKRKPEKHQSQQHQRPREKTTELFTWWLSGLAGRVQTELAGQRGFLKMDLAQPNRAQVIIGQAAQQAAAGTPLATKLAAYDPATQVILLFVVNGLSFEYTLQQSGDKWVY